MKELSVFMMVSLMALGVGVGVRFLERASNTTPIPLPVFEFPDVDGAMQSVLQWQGKTRIINFWATWCLPCLQEIPGFMALQANYGAENVRFIGVALDDKEAVRTFQQKNHVNYPLLIAGDKEGFHLAKALGNTVGAIPYTVVVDPAGQVIFRHAGELSMGELEKILLPLL